MAKKPKKETKKAPVEELPEDQLPQNILLIGERVEENKNIYISQSAYRAIRKFTKNKTTNESGGVLVGKVIEQFGKTNILISAFVEAKYCEATPTTLKFTHETWEYVHGEVEKKHKGKKILGWIHTHPDFGIFLSEYDKFIHQNFFSDENQVAYVVDPIQKIEGFYFWINGNIERCKGFYIYDKPDQKIKIGAPKEEEPEEEEEGPLFSFKNILIAILAVAVAVLLFVSYSANQRLEQLEAQIAELEQRQNTLVSSSNTALGSFDGMLNTHEEALQELRQALIDAGLLELPPEETEPTVEEPTVEEPTEPTAE